MHEPFDLNFKFVICLYIHFINVRFVVPNGREFIENDGAVYDELCIINPKGSALSGVGMAHRHASEIKYNLSLSRSFGDKLQFFSVRLNLITDTVFIKPTGLPNVSFVVGNGDNLEITFVLWREFNINPGRFLPAKIFEC